MVGNKHDQLESFKNKKIFSQVWYCSFCGIDIRKHPNHVSIHNLIARGELLQAHEMISFNLRQYKLGKAHCTNKIHLCKNCGTPMSEFISNLYCSDCFSKLNNHDRKFYASQSWRSS